MTKKSMQRNSTLFIAGVAAIAFLLLGSKSGWTGFKKPRVLGIQEFLADKGSDSESHDSGESKSSGGGSNSSSGGSGSGGSGSSGSSGTSGGSQGGSGSGSSGSTTTVATPRPTKTPKPEKPKVQETPKPTPMVNRQGRTIEFETEDGKVKVKERKADETEVELENENEALEDVNEALEPEDIHIGTAAGGFTIKRGETEAETHFPLSVNVATGQLTVTTPAGTKTVTILPDEAITNLLSHNAFDRIESASPAAQKIELTEVENQPAFAVKGLDDKRLLGFIPVTIRKTAFVSAQNGGVIRTDEDPLNRLLDLLSF